MGVVYKPNTPKLLSLCRMKKNWFAWCYTTRNTLQKKHILKRNTNTMYKLQSTMSNSSKAKIPNNHHGYRGLYFRTGLGSMYRPVRLVLQDSFRCCCMASSGPPTDHCLDIYLTRSIDLNQVRCVSRQWSVGGPEDAVQQYLKESYRLKPNTFGLSH